MMTGLGSPCGACKFLRRKCVKGCIFAPYFSHEQGAAHFAAIHKVFGASNVSKLLAHLPVTDRCEAAVTISYEAQARLQDPIYGCVAHIFTLQQQVVNLQSQLASLKSQAAQGFVNGSAIASSLQEEKLYNKYPPYQQNGQEFFQFAEVMSATQPSASAPLTNGSAMVFYGNGLADSSNISFSTDDNSSCSIRPTFHDMEDLQSVAFAYLHRA